MVRKHILKLSKCNHFTRRLFVILCHPAKVVFSEKHFDLMKSEMTFAVWEDTALFALSKRKLLIFCVVSMFWNSMKNELNRISLGYKK